MMKTRKILFYTHALSGGGAERVWTLLASGFARRGCEVIVAVDFDAHQNLMFLDKTVRLVTLGGGHAASTLRLARLIAREKPDATISALSVSNLKHFVAAALALRRDRTILSYHGYAVSEPQRLSQISYWLTPLMTRLTARTICVSDGLLAYAVDSWNATKARTLRIYNPVMIGERAGALDANALERRRPVVLACGRMVPYKNFPGLVRAFAQVPQTDAVLKILGEGEQRAAIEAEVKRLGLEDRVELLGYVDEPWKVYAQARCFALSSTSESFGLVVVEALASGLAVVATDCDGPREILQDGHYGTLVPQGDETALAQALSAALSAPGDPAARQARAADFSLDIGLDHYAALIEEVVLQALKGAPERRAIARQPKPQPGAAIDAASAVKPK